VSALGAQWCDQPRFADGAEKAGSGTEQLGAPAHRVGGVVVVETAQRLVCCHHGPPTHLHFHVARILQGTVGIPETGGMYRVAIEDVSAWTVGDFSYSDH
jgi:hypothetical protein